MSENNHRLFRYVKAHEIATRIKALRCEPKSNTIAGLELADLVVSRIARQVLEMNPREHSEVRYDVIEQKFRRNQHGNIAGVGLIRLP